MGARLTLPAVPIPRDFSNVIGMGPVTPENRNHPVIPKPMAYLLSFHGANSPAGKERDGLRSGPQGLPLYFWVKTNEQRSVRIESGPRDTRQEKRPSRKGAGGPPRKGGGKPRVDFIRSYVEEHGAQRCGSPCEVCLTEPKPCCHWANHRYPPEDWLICDCIIRETRPVRLEDTKP